MWEVDPSTLITLGVAAALYAMLAVVLKGRPSGRQMAAFTSALLIILIAITGPINQLTKDRSFSVYIFQQLLLIFAAPPLLLLGLPDWMLRPLFLNRLCEPTLRVITRPLFGFLSFASVFTLIHYPAVCDRVCHVDPFYGGIHALLLLTGTLLWWPLLSPLPEYPRMSYPMQILYLFLLMIPMTAVAAPITMADSVLYMFYVGGTHPFGLSPREDQVVGGIIMWVGQATYIMFVFSAIFYRWQLSEDDEMPPINRQAVTHLRVLHGKHS